MAHWKQWKDLFIKNGWKTQGDFGGPIIYDTTNTMIAFFSFEDCITISNIIIRNHKIRLKAWTTPY